MAKQFFTNGTGSQQTLTPSQNEKVAIYDTVADAEADLANLEEGQIVATPDTGDENAQPVDVIQAGNMHAITSNATYEGLHLKVNKSTNFNFSTTKNGITVKIKNKGDFTFVELSGTSTTDMYHQVNFDDTIPSAYRPSNIGIFPIVNRSTGTIAGFLYILNDGTLFMYFPSQIGTTGMFCSGVYLN